MRKLIVSINITIDGFVAGPNGNLNWHFDRWTKEMADAQCEQLSNADTILLGGTTYRAMAAYWVAANNDICYHREDIAFAHMMNSRQKVVFSNTIDDLSWENSKRTSGSLIKEVTRLKTKPGNDIIIYGSIELVAGLLDSELIDSYQLWLHPVLLGKGKTLFSNNQALVNMHLSNAITFSTGVVLLKYDKCQVDNN